MTEPAPDKLVTHRITIDGVLHMPPSLTEHNNHFKIENKALHVEQAAHNVTVYTHDVPWAPMEYLALGIEIGYYLIVMVLQGTFC